ncbi:MAG: hypothetical protein EDQ89_11130 [Acidobacteria bacterium]|nr:MAG: hypothetical protein EDQ89_11130 [Acidobacteriota bacterium]GIK77027.1 MAG: hypothetical protein BroJett022_07170 [Actinomycetes bacterium]
MRAGAATDAAAAAVARLGEGAGVRACAVLDSGGELLAASADNDWAAQAERIWDAAADPQRPAPAHVHVATDGGEVFAVRGPAGAIIAVADRFALASLMLCDLRAALRGLDRA